MQKQVDRAHYDFEHYMSKERWSSIWHQLHEVQKVAPRTVLEVGPGSNVFKLLIEKMGIKVETIDIDPELNPDYVGSADKLPFESDSYDAVCAFQVLEHMPYEISLKAFREMARVSREKIIISLPDADKVYPFMLDIPFIGFRSFFMKRPKLRAKSHIFDGQHYWEVNKSGFKLNDVIADLSECAELELTYRVNDNPYHRFFIFSKL